jgi:iron complex transport system permease protein
MVNIVLGDAKIPFEDVFSILLGGKPQSPALVFIVEERWLRTLNALLSGGALAFCGTVLQSFFRNPLAGPGVLGVSSGASLGVATAILTAKTTDGWVANFSEYSLGFAGAFFVLFVLLVLNRWVKGVTLLVVGLMMGFFTGAFVNLLLNFSNQLQTRKYVEWGFGTFSMVNRETFYFYGLSLLILLLISLLYFPKLLNAWVYGENQVETAGYSVRSSRFFIVLLVGVITTMVTLQCGPVSFVGIAVPQIVRLFFKTTHHFVLLLASIVGGGLMALASDIVLRNAGLALPLNAVTALFGAPIIIFIILRYSKNQLGQW